MKNFLYITLGISLLFSACVKKEEKATFTINGKVASADLEGKPIYLQKLDYTTDEYSNIDTVLVQNGAFAFTGNAEVSPEMGFVTFETLDRPISIVLEAGNIELEIDSSLIYSTVTGTKINNKLNEFYNVQDSTWADHQKRVYELLKPLVATPAGEYLFMISGRIVDETQLKDLLSIISPEAKAYPKVQALEKRLAALEATAVGQPYTDLKGLTPDGKAIALSDYAGKGKYVLVDFWASWCPPCREEMPNLVEAYKKYKNKGFEIVGVSLDDNNAAWQKGIKNLNVTWPQISDLKGWKSDLAATYAVSSIPQTLLLDKDGNIIAKNLREEALAEKLNELFN